MKSWTTKNVIVTEIPFDHDLHEFEVTTLAGDHLGVITPANIGDMEDMITELDTGACPVENFWEDGHGNTCSITGW